MNAEFGKLTPLKLIDMGHQCIKMGRQCIKITIVSDGSRSNPKAKCLRQKQIMAILAADQIELLFDRDFTQPPRHRADNSVAAFYPVLA